jgi:hypothetical protein
LGRSFLKNNIMIIDKKLTQPIVDWCLHSPNRQRYFRDPGYHSGDVSGQTHLEYVNPKFLMAEFPYAELFEIQKILLQYYNFKDFYMDEEFGIMISYSEAGHEVHEHTDKNYRPADIHTRINLMISKPEKGGLAVINKKIIDIEENEPWLCAAGYYEHSSTKVEGKTPRVVISFGYQVNKEELKEKKWI